MQTYSHYLMTLALKHQLQQPNTLLKRKSGGILESLLLTLPPLKSRAALLGSVAPDVPLTTMAIVCIIADAIRKQRSNDPEAMPSWTGHLFSTLFFQNRWVKAVHNLFHAPILTLAYLVVGYWAWGQGKSWGGNLFWFGVTTTLHTGIDIPLHYNDGPLLYFPFDWETRFYSPVSYWDPKRYGRPFAIFEHLLLVILLIYVIRVWRQARKLGA
ncbi:MAG: hypothetical protein AAF629_20235 [Chloroflexota bacterium]